MPRGRSQRALLVFCLFLLQTVPVSIAWAGERYSNPVLGFQVDLPVTPEVVETEVRMASGPAQVLRLKAWGDTLRTAVTVVTFARAPFTVSEADIGLEQSRNRQIAQVMGKLVTERDITLAGYAGKELLIAFGPAAQTYHYRVHTYYIENRQFLISVIGPKREVLSTSADLFFESFVLTPLVSGTPIPGSVCQAPGRFARGPQVVLVRKPDGMGQIDEREGQGPGDDGHPRIRQSSEGRRGDTDVGNQRQKAQPKDIVHQERQAGRQVASMIQDLRQSLSACGLHHVHRSRLPKTRDQRALRAQGCIHLLPASV